MSASGFIKRKCCCVICSCAAVCGEGETAVYDYLFSSITIGFCSKIMKNFVCSGVTYYSYYEIDGLTVGALVGTFTGSPVLVGTVANAIRWYARDGQIAEFNLGVYITNITCDETGTTIEFTVSAGGGAWVTTGVPPDTIFDISGIPAFCAYETTPPADFDLGSVTITAPSCSLSGANTLNCGPYTYDDTDWVGAFIGFPGSAHNGTIYSTAVAASITAVGSLNKRCV